MGECFVGAHIKMRTPSPKPSRRGAQIPPLHELFDGPASMGSGLETPSPQDTENTRKRRKATGEISMGAENSQEKGDSLNGKVRIQNLSVYTTSTLTNLTIEDAQCKCPHICDASGETRLSNTNTSYAPRLPNLYTNYAAFPTFPAPKSNFLTSKSHDALLLGLFANAPPYTARPSERICRSSTAQEGQRPRKEKSSKEGRKAG